MNKKSIFTVLFSLFALSSCAGQTEVSRETVDESDTSVVSESDSESSRESESESGTAPVEETVPEETTPAEEPKPFFSSEEDEAAFALLGDYYTSDAWVDDDGINHSSAFHVSGEEWEMSEDYELFRKYFFGSWGEGETPLVIDDSESAWIAENWRSFHFWNFYKISENVLAFMTGGSAGGTLYWLDINDPNILYETEGAPGGFPQGILTDENGFPNVWILHKNDAEPNEPQNNYLSVYRLREMAQKYGIDYSMLVDVELETGAYYHDSRFYFYPMYLVSETDERIEIVTQAGDVYSDDPDDIRIILQKTDGEWTREVVSAE